ncbi:energy-coupling factor transporter transmembrane protein EcfT [Azospirillum sp. SYSU D00513]|uniref:energy-coupling factor transporter transmembrane component T family protein n=1 Tax=Azospirillum sp. SYSU D00513 TaxID=2812561 RepID=UPI001A975F89|nr:energy-coupling factor transporter transmembrane protein EcfT [Azospirillum sp. SYSU D00513]
MHSFYLERPGWLHRVPAGVKLAGLSLAGTALFMTADQALLGAAALAVAALYLSLGREAGRALGAFRGLAVALLLILLFHALVGSWRDGAVTALRLGSLSALGMALTLTTRFDDLLSVAETLLRPLKLFGLPAERMALAFGLMLRFIETFFAQWQRLDEAHRARSGRAGGWRLLAPLAIQALAAADRAAEALSARLGR